MSSPDPSSPDLSLPDPSSPLRTPAAAVLDAVQALGPLRRRAVLLIDGPSGAGKSTLADAVAAQWPDTIPPTLVRLDDIYPGWGGLTAAIRSTGRMLTDRAHGRPARWQRHDWVTDQGAEWHQVPPDRALIVEGCGALARANGGLGDVRVWLDADDGIRKERALARDQGAFEAHWDQWQADWQAYRAREGPERQANLRLRAAPA